MLAVKGGGGGLLKHGNMSSALEYSWAFFRSIVERKLVRNGEREREREREREGGIFTEYFLIIPKSEVREREGKESRKTQIKSKTRHEHCEGLSLSHTHIHSRYSSLC